MQAVLFLGFVIRNLKHILRNINIFLERGYLGSDFEYARIGLAFHWITFIDPYSHRGRSSVIVCVKNIYNTFLAENRILGQFFHVVFLFFSGGGV